MQSIISALPPRDGDDRTVNIGRDRFALGLRASTIRRRAGGRRRWLRVLEVALNLTLCWVVVPTICKLPLSMSERNSAKPVAGALDVGERRQTWPTPRRPMESTHGELGAGSPMDCAAMMPTFADLDVLVGCQILTASI